MTIPTFARVTALLLLASTAFALDDSAQRAPAAGEAAHGAEGGGDTTLKPDTGLFGEKEYKVETQVRPGFSINSKVRIEQPTGAPVDRAVLDHAGQPVASSTEGGLYLDQLYGQYENAHGGVRIGKYDSPNFGAARDPRGNVGMFGNDSPLDDYRVNRAVGVNPFGKYDAGAAGQLRVDGNLFRPEDAAGAAALGAPVEPRAAPALSSAASLNASNALGVGGLGYHMGLQHVAPDPAGDNVDRRGAAGGVSYGTSLLGNSLRTSAELGYMQDTDAAGGETMRPGLALQGALNDTWRAFASYQRAYTPEQALNDSGERRLGAGLGYKFDQGPSLDMSWQRKTEMDQGIDTQRQDDVGVRMRYDLKF